MSEKRYYILDSPHTMPFICDRLDNDKIIAEVHSDNVNQLCDLLNEQEERIKELEEENEQLKLRIKELELLNDGLNYALKNIKKIDVEIDLNECGDVE